MFGFTMQVTAEQAAPIRALDPFFLQGTASANDVSMYTSCKFDLRIKRLNESRIYSNNAFTVLQAPPSLEDANGKLVYQVCISGSTDEEPFSRVTAKTARTTNDERIAMIRETALGFAEPFRLFVSLISDDTPVKQLDLDDWSFPEDHAAGGTYTVVGDAAHNMTMCKYVYLQSSAKDIHFTCSSWCRCKSCHSGCAGAARFGFVKTWLYCSRPPARH